MLSVVIPVYNQKDYLHRTLSSLFANTKHLSELILVDDCSDTPTEEYIRSIRTPGVRVTVTRNPVHSWTNPSWNAGVALATEPYVALLNSDITVSYHWDTYLIELLEEGFDCACPYLTNSRLATIIEAIDPYMIQGSCFMFDNPRYCNTSPFPIPDFLKHWFGDRYLADFWNEENGIDYSPEAIIDHAVSKSTPHTKEYREVITQDLIAYENFTMKEETLVREALGI